MGRSCIVRLVGNRTLYLILCNLLHTPPPNKEACPVPACTVCFKAGKKKLGKNESSKPMLIGNFLFSRFQQGHIDGRAIQHVSITPFYLQVYGECPAA